MFLVWVDFGVGFFLVGCEEGGDFGWVGNGDVRLFLGTSFWLLTSRIFFVVLSKSLSQPRFTSLPPSHLTSLPLSPSSVSHPHPPSRPTQPVYPHTPTYRTPPSISSHLPIPILSIPRPSYILMQPTHLISYLFISYTPTQLYIYAPTPHPLIY